MVPSPSADAEYSPTLSVRASPELLIVDDYAVLAIQGDAASFPVVAQSLVNAHPGGAHQPREVGLGEAQGDEHTAARQGFAVLAGEGEDLCGDPAVHVERRQRAGVGVGEPEPPREDAHQVAGDSWHLLHAGEEGAAVHPQEGRVFEGEDAGRATEAVGQDHLADDLSRPEDGDDGLRNRWRRSHRP